MRKRITSLTLATALIASSYGVSASPYPASTGNSATWPAGSSVNTSAQLPRKPMNQAAAPNLQLIKLAQKPWQKKWKPGPWPKHHHHRGHYNGVEIGIGIAILGLLAAGAAKSNGYQRAMRQCDRDFRSFDWDSGTYVTYGGDVRLCPYLEPYVD